MIVLAFFVAQKRESSGIEIRWVIALGLSGFFCLFTVGMVLNSFWMVLRNVTTIENINSFTGTIFLAVLLPERLQGQNLSGPPPPPSQVPLQSRRSGTYNPFSY